MRNEQVVVDRDTVRPSDSTCPLSSLAVVVLIEDTWRVICLYRCPFISLEQGGMRTALDYDLTLSCVDRAWPRHLENTLAYADAIPGSMDGTDWSQALAAASEMNTGGRTLSAQAELQAMPTPVRCR